MKKHGHLQFIFSHDNTGWQASKTQPQEKKRPTADHLPEVSSESRVRGGRERTAKKRKEKEKQEDNSLQTKDYHHGYQWRWVVARMRLADGYKTRGRLAGLNGNDIDGHDPRGGPGWFEPETPELAGCWWGSTKNYFAR